MPVICQYDGCMKVFKCNQNLQKHVRNVHLGNIDEKLCPESGCNRRIRADHLARHIVQAHNHPNEPAQCGNCFAFLPSDEALTKHSDRVHGGITRKRSVPPQIGGGPPLEPKRRKIDELENDLPFEIDNSQTDVGQVYRDNWSKIRTHVHKRKFQHTYNFRVEGQLNPEPIMETIFNDQHHIFKLNVSAGFILRNRVTDELRYYWACEQNAKVFDKPFVIKDRPSLDIATEGIADFVENSYEYAYRQKPSSSWFVEAVTNISFIANPLPNHAIGTSPIMLPDHVSKNKGLYSLTCTNHGPITDNLCVFRCLAMHNGATNPKCLETEAEALFRMYETAVQPHDFDGVRLSELTAIEKKFSVGIIVYELVVEGVETAAKVIRRPLNKYGSSMKVCKVDNHFAFIHDFSKFAKSFCCARCGQIMNGSFKCSRHEKTCNGGQKVRFQGGVYRVPRTIFEELEDEGFVVPQCDRLFPFRITYDLETYFAKENKKSGSGDMTITATHIPLSASVCSNVPGFSEPQCFVAESENESHKVILQMVEYMEKISAEASKIERKKFSKILTEDDSTNKYTKKLLKRLGDHLDQCPVIGFCSSRYDLNVCKTILLPYLARYSKIKFAIKKANAFLMITTPTLRFLDIAAYLAPGWSYAKFLAAFKCTEKKSHFPFSYVDRPERLNEKGIPPRSAFFDSLQNKELSDNDYAEVLADWNRLGMVNLRDLLVFYNNKDTKPLIDALGKYCEIYAAQGLDPFKDAISVPGLANRELFSQANEPANATPRSCGNPLAKPCSQIDKNFFLFNNRDKDLHEKVKKGLTGGPSFIFHRFHESGVTKIRNSQNTVRKLFGFDSNSLYLGCTTLHDMPCGMYRRRDEEHGFRPKWPRVYGRQARTWLDWVAQSENVRVRTQYNATEKVLSRMEKPVRADGWIAEKNTVLQYHGCHWHGHQNCPINKRDILRRTDGDERATFTAMLIARYNDTVGAGELIRQAGYILREKWECEWNDDQAANEELAAHCDSYKTPMEVQFGNRALKQQQIIDAIKSGTLFGIVECDIYVPTEWMDAETPMRLKTDRSPREYFADLPPIFKNISVPFSEIGETMQKFVRNNNLSEKPRRLLISSYFGEKQMFITDMLIWLMNHGLAIEHIYSVIEYERAKPFVSKGDSICDARRAGDVDPDLAIIAEMRKLTGNSFYGKPLTNQDAQLTVSYLNDKKAGNAMNSGFFQHLETLDDGDENDCGIHEVTCLKKRINYNLPISIGFFTYQLAKLRLLQFLYDCIDRYISRDLYQLCQCDTDSMYLAVAGESLFDVLKPDNAMEFYQSYNSWFPARACEQHKEEWINAMMVGDRYVQRGCCAARARYEKRTPELFKLEWEGDGFIGLCSKTYYCWANEGVDKFAAKGVNKTRNVIDKDTFLNVLRSQATHRIENSGFRLLNNQMKTYVQRKDGMTYNYWKRKVMPDGVTTAPLDI